MEENNSITLVMAKYNGLKKQFAKLKNELEKTNKKLEIIEKSLRRNYG